MKISYVYFHDVNHVPIHVDEIINELKKRKYEVHLFTSIKNHKTRKKILLSGVKLHNLRTLEVRHISEFIFMALLLPYLLVRACVFKPDIFYSRNSACSMIALFVSKVVKKPCLIEINDITEERHRFIKISKLKRVWVKLYHFINYRLANYLLPVTESIKNWIIDNYSVNQKKIVVCSNGVNIERFQPKPIIQARKRYKIPIESKVILSLGSLFPWSGIEILIESAPKIIKVFPQSLFVIGSGEEPYLSELKKRAEKKNVKKHFLFYGFIPWNDASWFISIADVCACPYILKSDRTGLSSLRVFSYLACGKPVVGSNIKGLGDMLKNHRIGISVPVGDSDLLAESIIALMSDDNLMRNMGMKGRKCVIENYSWPIIVNKIERLFRI